MIKIIKNYMLYCQTDNYIIYNILKYLYEVFLIINKISFIYFRKKLNHNINHTRVMY